MHLYSRPPMPLRTPDMLPVLLSLTAGAGGYVATWAGFGAPELAGVGGGLSTLFAALWFGTWHYHVALEQEHTERRAVELEHSQDAPEPAPVVSDENFHPVAGGVYNRTTNTLTLYGKPKQPRKRNPYRGHRMEVITRAEVLESADGNRVRYYDVGELFWRWAKYGGADATSTAEREWTPKSAGKPFEPDEYLALRKWLMGQGLAWWKNSNYHKSGWVLRNRARAIMHALRESPGPLSHTIVPYSVDDDAVG